MGPAASRGFSSESFPAIVRSWREGGDGLGLLWVKLSGASWATRGAELPLSAEDQREELPPPATWAASGLRRRISAL